MTGTMLRTIAEINASVREEFVTWLGGVFEHSPWLADAAWSARPFADRAALHRAMVEVVNRASPGQQLALIRAHPDLVGRAALAGTLTRASTAEQEAAGLDPGRLTEAERTRFADLNAAYQSRFGFPFIICARENTKATILAAFEQRLGHDRDQEIRTALDEIAKIARLRLTDLVNEH
jgi:2-oxo-4-hydroxy-4-carboxy-5-ureidoimidazoline decarboxylase